MGKKLFDFLRIVQIVIPALGTLYAALAAAWGWDYSEPIVATCAALTAFIGVLLKIQSDAFFSNKEILEVEADVDSQAN